MSVDIKEVHKMKKATKTLLLILCVPIAVTALVFSIKAIRKNSWGA